MPGVRVVARCRRLRRGPSLPAPPVGVVCDDDGECCRVRLESDADEVYLKSGTDPSNRLL